MILLHVAYQVYLLLLDFLAISQNQNLHKKSKKFNCHEKIINVQTCDVITRINIPQSLKKKKKDYYESHLVG